MKILHLFQQFGSRQGRVRLAFIVMFASALAVVFCGDAGEASHLKDADGTVCSQVVGLASFGGTLIGNGTDCEGFGSLCGLENLGPVKPQSTL